MAKVDIFTMLKRCKRDNLLSFQQYRTIKGQAIAGDIEGAWKGLKTVLQRQKKEGAINGSQT